MMTYNHWFPMVVWFGSIVDGADGPPRNSSIETKKFTIPYQYTEATINADTLFSEGRSIALYHAGILLTVENPIIRMGTRTADVYLMISMDNTEEISSANCMHRDTVGKLSKHVMHSTASMVEQAIESMGIPVKFVSHIDEDHKLPISAFGEMQVQQGKGWLTSSRLEENEKPTMVSTTTVPTTTSTSMAQGDQPRVGRKSIARVNGLNGLDKSSVNFLAPDRQDDGSDGVLDADNGHDDGIQGEDKVDLEVNSNEELDGDWPDDYVVEAGETNDFNDNVARTVFDFDLLQQELQETCCQKCLCRSHQIGTEEVIDLGLKVESMTIKAERLVLDEVSITAVNQEPAYAWLLNASGATVVVAVNVQGPQPTLKTSQAEIKVAFKTPIELLRIMIAIQGCPGCGQQARLIFEEAQGRHRRNIFTDMIGTVDSNEFFKQVQKLHEQADLDRKAIEDEDKKLINELSNARIARAKVNQLVGSIADRVCENNVLVKSMRLKMELKIHSSNIANHVANEISMCRTDSLPSMVNQAEILKACEAEYPMLCQTGEFLFQFKMASSCQVQAVVMSAETIVLKMVITYPKGPRVSYKSRLVTKVPVFSTEDTGTASFNVEENSMLVRTATGHMTVISDCSSQTMLHQRTWICDIARVDQMATRCMKLLLEGKSEIRGKAREECVTFSPSAQECFVKRVSNMLWTSSRVPLRIVNTEASNLHGFWDQDLQLTIDRGVNLVTNKKAKAIQCMGFVYETNFATMTLNLEELDHFSYGLNINVDIIKNHEKEEEAEEEAKANAGGIEGIGFQVQRFFDDEVTRRKTIGIGTAVMLIVLAIIIFYCLKCTAAGARVLSSLVVSIRRCCPCLRSRLQLNAGGTTNQRQNRTESVEMK